MADPIFSEADRVDNDALPPELVGKSPKEIAQFYARREQIILDRAQRTPPPARTAEPEVEENIDIFNHPDKSVKKIVDQRVAAATTAAVSSVAPGIISGCKVAMASKFGDWRKFAPEVEKIMGSFTVEAQMNPDMWENAYYTIKGRQADRLVEEAVTQSKTPVEKPSAKGQEPPAPRQLGDEELRIAGKFGIDGNTYREAAERYESTYGVLPFTYDQQISNRGKAKKAS